MTVRLKLANDKRKSSFFPSKKLDTTCVMYDTLKREDFPQICANSSICAIPTLSSLVSTGTGTTASLEAEGESTY